MKKKPENIFQTMASEIYFMILGYYPTSNQTPNQAPILIPK